MANLGLIDHKLSYKHKRFGQDALKSNIEPMQLIRKRSFAIPGVATRIVKATARARTINTEPISVIAEPSTGRRASFERFIKIAGTENLSRCCDAMLVARAETPADLACLGPFELGTLMVTNGGPASRQPSATSSGLFASESDSEKSYYTATEELWNSDWTEWPNTTTRTSYSSLKVEKERPYGQSQLNITV
jgi:hypothetical protein